MENLITVFGAGDESCAWGFFYDYYTQSMLWYRVIITCILPLLANLTVWCIVSTCYKGLSIETVTILVSISSVRVVLSTKVPLVLSTLCLVALGIVRLHAFMYPKKTVF
jgi:hypothetical protein